jgi:hypothetical protein
MLPSVHVRPAALYRRSRCRPYTTSSAVVDEPVCISPFFALTSDPMLTHSSIPTHDSKVQISSPYELGSQNSTLYVCVLQTPCPL